MLGGFATRGSGCSRGALGLGRRGGCVRGRWARSSSLQDARARRGGRRRSDAGSTSLEVVLLVPVLMLLALFVLWAGRGGRAGLIADLAAEEAATAAALACEAEAADDSECEALVADVLSARPGLDFLCIGGALESRDAGLVDQRHIRFQAGDGGGLEATGVALYGVEFLCETDGAVAPLRGLFPTVTFRGQAVEVAIQQSPPKVEIRDASAIEGLEEDEGDVLRFVVSLDAPAPINVALPYTIDEVTPHTTGGDNCAANPQPDYETPSLRSVPIRKGAVEEFIEIQTCDDTLHEADETITVTLEPPRLDPEDLDSLPAVQIEDGVAEGTIHDDDAPPLVTVSEPEEREGAGSLLVFEVELPPVGRDVTLTYSTAPGSGEAPAIPGAAGRPCPDGNEGDPIDYIAIDTGSHTFGPSTSDQNTVVRVQQCDDLVGEPDETLDLVWSTSPAGFGSGAAAGTITDDEPRLMIRDTCTGPLQDGIEPADACVGENAGPLVFTVERVVHPAVLSAPPEVTARFVTRPNPVWGVAHDAEAGGLAVGEQVRDPCSSPPEEPLDARGSGEYHDYVPQSDTVTIPAGTARTTATVTVTIYDDALDEHNETLWLLLCQPSDNAFLDEPWGRAIIVDDDPQPTVIVGDATADEPADETDTAELRFDVRLSAVSGRDVTVDYWTESVDDYDSPSSAPHDVQDLTAAADVDYTALPMDPSGSVAFSAEFDWTTVGERIAVPVLVLHDLLDEGYDDAASAETMALRLSASNAGFEDTSGSCAPTGDDDLLDPDDDDTRNDCALGLIVDNDTPPAVSVFGPSAAVVEGGNVVFEVRLVDPADPTNRGALRPSGVEVSVDVEVEVVHRDTPGAPDTLTASAADLILPLTSTVTFEPDDPDEDARTVQTFTVRTRLDVIDELDPETFELRLVPGSEVNAVRGVDGTGAIADDDAPPALVVLDTCIDVSVWGQAVADQGDACKGESDGSMQFRVGLVDPGNPATSLHSGRDITVLYETRPRRTDVDGFDPADGTDDYVAVTATTDADRRRIEIPAGQKTGTFDIALLPDDIDELDELFFVHAAEDPDNAGVVQFHRWLGQGVIVDDDDLVLRVVDTCGPHVEDADGNPTVDVPACAGESDGNVVFTLALTDPDDPSLRRASSQTVTVDYYTLDLISQGNRAATAGQDYTGRPSSMPVESRTLEIEPTHTQGTISIPVTPDVVYEHDEIFQLVLESVSNASLVGGDRHTGAILDDEDPPRLSLADADGTEDGPVEFTATLLQPLSDDSARIGRVVTVEWATADGTATSSGDTADYLASTGVTITFDPNNSDADARTLQTLSVDIVDDDLDEAPETFEVRIGPVAPAEIAPAAGARPCVAVDDGGSGFDGCAVGTVTDNDDPPALVVLDTCTDVSVWGQAVADQGDACKGESDGSMQFRVGLVDPGNPATSLHSGRDITVLYETRPRRTDVDGFDPADGTDDYVAVTATTDADRRRIEIPAGQKTGTFDIALLPDDIDELDELFFVHAAEDPDNAGVVQFHRWLGQGVIVDDDDLVLRVVDTCGPHVEDADGNPTVDVPACAGESDGNVVFTLALTDPDDPSLRRASSQTVTVDYYTLDLISQGNRAATAGQDYTGRPSSMPVESRTLEIEPTHTQGTISIPVTPDVVYEHDEIFQLVLESVSNASLVGGDRHTGAILDDEDPPRLSLADADGTEDGPVEFTATLLQPLSDDSARIGRVVTVEWATADGTATSSGDTADYLASTGVTITFDPNNSDADARTLQTLSVDIVDDDLDEAPETFEVRIGPVAPAEIAPAAGARPCVAVDDGGSGFDGCAVGTVTDNDDPPALVVLDTCTDVSVWGQAVADQGDACKGESDGSMQFRVGLVDPGNPATSLHSGRDITVLYETRPRRTDVDGFDPADGTDDYVAVTATTDADRRRIEIPAGQKTGTFDIALLPDDIDELDELFFVHAAEDPDNAGVVQFHRWLGQGVIVDDDDLVLRVVDTCGPHVEDADGNPTVDVPACAGESDGNVVFTLALTDPDDPSLRRASSQTVTVDYYTLDLISQGNRAATAGQDYTGRPSSMPVESRTLEIEPTHTQGTISIPVTPDVVYEHDEIFQLVLESVSNASLVGGDRHTGAILDDEDPPRLSLADADGTEDGPVEFTATLLQPLSDDSARIGRVVTVEWATADGTATSSGDTADYLASTGVTITFDPNNSDADARTLQTLSVDIVDDDLDEAPETFEVRIGPVAPAEIAPAAGARPCVAVDDGGSGFDGCAVGTVTDNDDEPEVRIDPAEAAEGNDLVFTVRLVDPGDPDTELASGREITVDYETRTSGGSDAATPRGDGQPCDVEVPAFDQVYDYDYDYIAVSGQVTFYPEDPVEAARTAKAVTVATCDDWHDELDAETLTLSLSGAANADIVAGENSATGTIDDNEGLPLVNVIDSTVETEHDATATEAGVVVFTVQLENPDHEGRPGPSVHQITVPHHTNDIDAEAGLDYVAAPADAEAVFAPLETELRVAVSTLPDSISESDERFQLVLDPPPAGVAQRGDFIGIGNITDGCFDPDTWQPGQPVPQVIVGEATFDEDAGTVELPFTVTGHICGNRWFRHQWRFQNTDGEALRPNDFAYNDGVTSWPGNTVLPLTATIRQDDVDEVDETFTISVQLILGSVPTPIVEATFTIRDDDPEPVVQIFGPTDPVIEGDDMDFTVRLAHEDSQGRDDPSVASGRTVTVQYYTCCGDATAGVDYPAVPQDSAVTLRFGPNGVEEHTFSIRPTVDGDNTEEVENFQVRLQAPTNALLDNSRTANVEITDRACIDPDNDDEPTLTVQPVSVDEDIGRATLTATIDRPLCEEAPVQFWPYSSGSDSARQHDDYRSAVVEVSGVGPAFEVSVEILDDLVDESDETFTLWATWNGAFGWFGEDTATVTIADDDPEPVVQIFGPTDPVIEGDDMDFTVRLAHEDSQGRDDPSVASGRTVTVQYYTCCGDATAGVDYPAVPQDSAVTLRFGPNGVEEHTFSIRPTVDGDNTEEVENFQVRLQAPTNALLDNSRTANVEITDRACIDRTQPPDPDNLPTLTVPEEIRVGEGDGSVAVPVSMGPLPLCGGGKFRYVVVLDESTATFGVDYVGPIQANFRLSGTEVRSDTDITYSLVDDNTIEADETFEIHVFFCEHLWVETCSIGHPDPGIDYHPSWRDLDTAVSTVVIEDNDCIDWTSDDYDGTVVTIAPVYNEWSGAGAVVGSHWFEGGGAQSLVFELSDALCNDASVSYGTGSSGYARLGTDYELTGTSLDIVAGARRFEIPVTIIDDAHFDAHEFFEVEVQWVGTVPQSWRSIVRSRNLIVDDECRSPLHHTVEPHDQPPIVTIHNLDIILYEDLELDSTVPHSIDIPFCRWRQASITPTFHFDTAEEADFRDGELLRGTPDAASAYSAPRGVIRHSAPRPFDDEVSESDESLRVTLNWSPEMCAQYSAYCGQPDWGYTLTIVDNECITEEDMRDDTIDALELKVEDVTVGEGDDEYFATVSIDRALCQERSQWQLGATVDATNTATGEDVDLLSGTGHAFSAGQSVQRVLIRNGLQSFPGAIRDDSLDEDDETFKLTAYWQSSMPEHYTALGPSEGTVTIADNDPEPLLVAYDVEDFVDDSVAGATMVFTVGLENANVEGEQIASGRQVRVRYRTNPIDGATEASSSCTEEGADYVAEAGELVFTPGEQTKEVSVTICQDDDDEPVERIQLRLISDPSIPSPVNAEIGDFIGVGQLAGADPPELSFEDSNLSVNEGRAVTFDVVLEPANFREVTVDWATHDGTAVAGDDYTGASGTLNFASGETAKSLTVRTLSDSDDTESDEQFEVRLTDPVNATIADGGDTATVTIRDGCVTFDDADDPPPPEIMLDLEVVEGNEITVRVDLTGACIGPGVAVTHRSGPGTAEVTDFAFLDRQWIRSGDRFVAWQAQFTAFEDADLEDETVIRRTTWSSPWRGPPFSQITVTIIDDDEPIHRDDCIDWRDHEQDPPTITIADASELEGGQVNFLIELSQPFCTRFVGAEMNWYIERITAEEEDLQTRRTEDRPGDIGWGPMQAAHGWNLRTRHDTDTDDETFRFLVNWSDGMPDHYQGFDPVSAIGTIRDDD